MRARFLYGLGLSLIGFGLLTSLSGCLAPNPRHGLIIRGDWSLELNRVPWTAKRGADGYQQHCTACDCSTNASDSCQGEVCVEDMTSCMDDPCDDSACDDLACTVQKCHPAMRCLAKPCIAKASPALHSPQPARTPSGGGHSRFFPVPTRPAFSPRGGDENSIRLTPIPSPEVIQLPANSQPVATSSMLSQPAAMSSQPAAMSGPKVTDLQ